MKRIFFILLLIVLLIVLSPFAFASKVGDPADVIKPEALAVNGNLQ